MEVKQITRSIDPAHFSRAANVPPELIGPYLDSILITLHHGLDLWRYKDGPVEEVELALDAFIALWTVVESRRPV